jgi:hypothetical protein
MFSTIITFVNFILLDYADKLNAIIEKILFDGCLFTLTPIKVFFHYTYQFSIDHTKNRTLHISDRASDCYWKILAERARLKLDDELRENRQVC